MTLTEFERKVQALRALNGWVIVFEIRGPIIATIYDKETGVAMYRTGGTSLEALLSVMDTKFLSDSVVWERL